MRWASKTVRRVHGLGCSQPSRVQTSKKQRRHHSAEVIQSTSPAKKAMLPPRLLMKLQAAGRARGSNAGQMMAGWGGAQQRKSCEPMSGS